MSINRHKRTNSAITRPFSAVHEFVILQKDNQSIRVYSVESSGKYNLLNITNINNNVLEFNNFIDNNKIEQITIEKF